MADSSHPAITGLILAGGLGRRMGGVDKGLQCLDGCPLVAWAVQSLLPQVETLLINANRHAESYGIYGFPVVPDDIPDFAGPLAGLHAGLGRAETAWVVTVPCDSPFFPHDLVARLWQALVAANAEVAVACTEGHRHPVFCLCHTGLRDDLGAYLAAGGRRMGEWCQGKRLVLVDFDDQVAAFRNLNTPEDLAASASDPAQ